MLIVASTINILLTLHEIVDSEKNEKNKKDENFIIKFCFRIFRYFGAFSEPQIFKYSICMLIVCKLLTCLKRPVYRGLKGVRLEG